MTASGSSKCLNFWRSEPGPFNETDFEHSYLGYTLAEGGDFTVRDNRVYLKALGGLQFSAVASTK